MARALRRTFFAPLPRTSPLTILVGKFLPGTDFLKRTVSLSLAMIYFWTQIVFAQNVVMSMPPGAVPNFFHRIGGQVVGMKTRVSSFFHSGRVVFNSLPFGFDKLREDRERSGYLGSEKLIEREMEQQQRMETPQALQNLRG